MNIALIYDTASLSDMIGSYMFAMWLGSALELDVGEDGISRRAVGKINGCFSA